MHIVFEVLWKISGLIVTLHYENAANWDSTKSNGAGVPQLKGARLFSFEELRKYTNNFSEANDIGSGGYGKVGFDSISLFLSQTEHILSS